MAETVCASFDSNDSGSDPYRRIPARFCACAWLNWPEISVEPKIAPWIVGADTTLPSRVNATASPMCSVVYLPQIASPALLNVTFTT